MVPTFGVIEDQAEARHVSDDTKSCPKLSFATINSSWTLFRMQSIPESFGRQGNEPCQQQACNDWNLTQPPIRIVRRWTFQSGLPGPATTVQ